MSDEFHRGRYARANAKLHKEVREIKRERDEEASRADRAEAQRNILLDETANIVGQLEELAVRGLRYCEETYDYDVHTRLAVEATAQELRTDLAAMGVQDD